MQFSLDRELSFSEARKRMFELLGDYKVMALGSSLHDHVTVRNVSCLFYGERIRFKTDREFRKTKQLFENPRVALCWSGIQIEGLAVNRGLVREEAEHSFERLFEKYLAGSYNRYAHKDTEIIIEVLPVFAEIWDTSEEGKAVQIFLDFEKESVSFKSYD